MNVGILLRSCMWLPLCRTVTTKAATATQLDAIQKAFVAKIQEYNQKSKIRCEYQIRTNTIVPSARSPDPLNDEVDRWRELWSVIVPMMIHNNRWIDCLKERKTDHLGIASIREKTEA
ncbi:hypothetical protein CRM22_008294 [Opisthorchis felineus]|uniref:Uncharacterized protein n=1 Tax=Opisthorchis felineus TaxID=147828 RepID=A0A4S2LBU3_OPIFE|nr:hypothetical protein CRM22_008294 [Opisthorchis felineus]